MAIDINDPMAILNEEMNKADEKSSGLAPFFFSIQDKQKALIRPLLNMSSYVMLDKHEIYNPGLVKSNGKKGGYEVSAICAVSFHLACQHCVDAANNKKLVADKRFVIPIYLHAVVNVKTGQQVTYKKKNEDGTETELPIQGVRLLEMKRTSSILRDLVAAYNEDDEHDITTNDFVIQRQNIDDDKLQTKYTVTPKKPTVFTQEVPEWTRDRDEVLLQYADACPFKIINDESDVPPALQSSSKLANGNGGKVKNAPEF